MVNRRRGGARVSTCEISPVTSCAAAEHSTTFLQIDEPECELEVSVGGLWIVTTLNHISYFLAC